MWVQRAPIYNGSNELANNTSELSSENMHRTARSNRSLRLGDGLNYVKYQQQQGENKIF